jgi:hypothetical protein
VLEICRSKEVALRKPLVDVARVVTGVVPEYVYNPNQVIHAIVRQTCICLTNKLALLSRQVIPRTYNASAYLFLIANPMLLL